VLRGIAARRRLPNLSANGGTLVLCGQTGSAALRLLPPFQVHVAAQPAIAGLSSAPGLRDVVRSLATALP
jgi:hypothetical protein